LCVVGEGSGIREKFYENKFVKINKKKRKEKVE
jgi:hypothetical protein